MILHGRYICVARKPKMQGACLIRDLLPVRGQDRMTKTYDLVGESAMPSST